MSQDGIGKPISAPAFWTSSSAIAAARSAAGTSSGSPASAPRRPCWAGHALAAAAAGLAAGEIGDKVALTTWPNYHDPANFETFTAATGATVQVNVFGSNEEMLAKLQAGGTGWDVFVPTNYTISTYRSWASSSRSIWRSCPTSTPPPTKPAS